MQRYVLIGCCNAVQGKDQEFNDWYWSRHFKEILALPGVISGRRFVPAGAQLDNRALPYGYLGLFEVECHDPDLFFEELRARGKSGRMSNSTDVAAGSSLVLWEAMLKPTS